MKQTIKSKIARATNSNTELNKKILSMKKSWDEVESLLQPGPKTPDKKTK